MTLRLIKIAFALLLGVLLCEIVLGGLHLVFGASDRGGAEGAQVLCLGDSHTFGWNVDADSAWPARLQGLLAADGLDWNVANRGAPGKNTETLLGEVDLYLDADKPQVVLILAGLNNPWSRPHGEGATSVLDSSRTGRLTKLLLQQLSGGGRVQNRSQLAEEGHFEELQGSDGRTTVSVVNREGDLESFQIGGGTIDVDEVEFAYEWIKRDLIEIASRVRSAGATPVLLTYALESGDYLPNVNFSIREAAVDGEIALIDVAALFKPEVAVFGEERLFFADAHPRREGYGPVARGIHDGLVKLGLVEGAPLGDPFGELRGAMAPVPRLKVNPHPQGLVVEMEFEPALEYSLILSGGLAGEGEDLDWFGLDVPLARDEVFKRSSQSDFLRGRFQARPAAVVLSDERLAEFGAGEGPLFAVLVGRTMNWAMLAVSEPLRLR